MSYFDYKAIPAPRRSKKARGVREPAELLALTITDTINEQAREGWEFLRAETLPAETPRGLFRRAVEEPVSLLIFRRERESREPRLEARVEALRPAPEPAAPRPAPVMEVAPAPQAEAAPQPRPEATPPSVRTFAERVQAASAARREPPISGAARAPRQDQGPSPLRPGPRFGPAETN
ncbi:DUF4177 domain-containing protein [Rhodobacteraceae bacterium DSL-40]|uniref:DUF4177 domain-containing protein n=1 Tax=Amaricoccus sp. B4 TaxID=3368557 RepID=UPI000DADAF33